MTSPASSNGWGKLTTAYRQRGTSTSAELLSLTETAMPAPCSPHATASVNEIRLVSESAASARATESGLSASNRTVRHWFSSASNSVRRLGLSRVSIGRSFRPVFTSRSKRSSVTQPVDLPGPEGNSLLPRSAKNKPLINSDLPRDISAINVMVTRSLATSVLASLSAASRLGVRNSCVRRKPSTRAIWASRP